MRILEVDFSSESRQPEYSFEYGGVDVRVEVRYGGRDIELTRRIIASAKGKYDAVAISGFSLTYTVGDKYHRHKKLRSLLAEEESDPTVVCDGIRAKDTIERWVMRRIAEQLEGEIAHRRILVLSAMDRWGVSEVSSSLKSTIVYGDLMYNLRFGIPLLSLEQVKAMSRPILSVVTRAPLDWYFPGARRHGRRLPRWRHAFYWAEVIVGGITYLKRYAPAQLEGKTVIADVHSDDEVEWLRARGVGTIASLTPVISGQRIGASVMEAVLTLATRGKVGHRRDRYLDEIIRIEPGIEIISFKPSVSQIPASDTETLETAGPIPFAAAEIPADFSAQLDAAKYAFVIHPLVFKQLLQHPLLKRFKNFVPPFVLEQVAARTPPSAVGRIRGLESKTGAKAEGLLLALPMTSKIMLRMPPEYVYERLIELAEIGQEYGATVMGLGAFTSVIGDAGETVARRSPIAITTGNSFTVAATMETIEVASAKIGIDIAGSTALVVGATGSIGSVLARLLAEKVAEIVLVSPRPERLIGLGGTIKKESPAVKLTTTTNVNDHIGRADIVVTTSSAVDPIISVEKLMPGALVCDVARPPDIREETAALRPDVLVIESGEISPPSQISMNIDIGLPPNTVYACLAETMILALEGINRHFTLGRSIKKDKVKEITELGAKHGFSLAGFRSFGHPVSDERLELIRAARAAKRGDREEIV